jgi:hypothetical protein
MPGAELLSDGSLHWQLPWQDVTRVLPSRMPTGIREKPLCERLRTPPSPFAATRRIPDPSLSSSIRERGQGTGTAACGCVVDEWEPGVLVEGYGWSSGVVRRDGSETGCGGSGYGDVCDGRVGG